MSTQNEVYQVGDSEKLKLLVWKNFILQRNQKVQILVTVLIPLFFVFFLLSLRMETLTRRHPEKRFMDVPIDNMTLLMEAEVFQRNVPKAYLCYTPETPENAAIAKTAAVFLLLNGSRPYEVVPKMEKDILKHNFLAGIEFGENTGSVEGGRFPLNFTYSLRFPSELRSAPPETIEIWMTAQLFIKFNPIGPRNPEYHDGGIPPGYLREGFLTVQHALTLSWLSLAAGQDISNFPPVVLRRFPYRAFTSDKMPPLLRGILPFMIMASFMYPCSVVASSVTTEKELQLKEIMKMMGVDNWLHWIAWFLKSYLVLMTVGLLILFLFKVKTFTSVPIFTHSHWIPIMLFMHTYVIASICFCFMLAVFFSKASTTSVVTCICWYATFIPFTFIAIYYQSISLQGKLMIALLFPNTAMALGISIIMELDVTEMGATWSSMFQSVSADDDISLFYIIMTLTLSAFLYLIICLYVELVFPGNYGIPHKWNFFLLCEFWCGPKDTTSPRQKGGGDPGNRQVGIELYNLQKSYGNFKAVKGLDLKMYRDEITVLLGHNGAGKTTTLHMLTGMVPPTGGTALINGYDIRTQIDKARQSLGICPQNNILFLKMSVRDHIKFFSKLKGVRGSEAVDREVSKYVGILGLQAKSKVAAERLSGGMKRKLSLCCAMCGSARVVLCDEPSSGIDAAGRKSLWELLQAEKRGRTVLLTTHYMDEADVLGDRIAILSEGKLECYGTSLHLKKRYGTGYQLVCIMLPGCDVGAVTELINRHLPSLLPEREMGTELTYRLPHGESKKFAALLADLDENCADLKLSGYGLSVATLEDVFMAVNKEKRFKGGLESSDTTSLDFQTLVFDTTTREKRPLIRCLMCFQALLMKKIQVTFRNYWLTLMQIVLPVVLLILVTCLGLVDLILYNNAAMQISPFQYKSSYVVMQGNSASDQLSPLATAYAKYVEHYGKRSQLLRTGDLSVEDYILGLDKSWNYRLDYEFVAGVTIDAEKTTVWLNNEPLHTAPLTLNYLHNAMARQYLGQEAGTYVTNEPLPYRSSTRNPKFNNPMVLSSELAANLALCMCFVTAFFAIPIIKERETQAKLLQFLSGIDAFAYWTTMFLWDFLIFIISALMAILALAAFREPGISSFSELKLYYAIILIFGLAALPLTYVFSNIFKNAATGYICIVVFNLFTGTFLFLINEALQAINIKKPIWYFRVFPHFCLANAVRNLFLGIYMRRMCSKSSCKIPGYFAWKSPGVLPEIVYLTTVALVLFTFLILKDAKLFHALNTALTKLCKSSKKRRSGGSSTENLDVTEERMLVRDLISSGRKDIPLLVDNIRKHYKKKQAVRGVSFHVANAECFGLLGINGAGKTSVFKMLTGDIAITSGDAYIDGLNVSSQMRKVLPKIGYCPQFDALFEDLTGRQNLRFYCLVRGIQQSYVPEISWTLAQAFGFEKHLDKNTKVYSGGNKRKLSTAIAILGNPSVVFLDEPTSGMDPGARRQLWQVMSLIRTAGKSLVLTSHSMDECEALCTSLTIMVDGEFKCIGSTQSLKNQYAKGLVLKVKVDSKPKKTPRNVPRSSSSSLLPVSSTEVSGTVTESDGYSMRNSEEINLIPVQDFSDRISNVKTFIRNHFPEAELKAEYNGLLTYNIPQEQKLSEVFRLIESNKKKLHIEDYLIAQTRLEEIFLDFALNCENREADIMDKKCCGFKC